MPPRKVKPPVYSNKGPIPKPPTPYLNLIDSGKRTHGLIPPDGNGRAKLTAKAKFDLKTLREQLATFKTRMHVYHEQLVDIMGAVPRAIAYYHSENWEKWYGPQWENIIYMNVSEHLFTAKVYYLPHYIAKEEVPRLVAAVPVVCDTGDAHIQLPSLFEGIDPGLYGPGLNKILPDTTVKPLGTGFVMDSKKHALLTNYGQPRFHDLPQAISACPSLLNIFERRRSRMKCIASNVDLFAARESFGRPITSHQNADEIQRNIIVVTGAVPQFYASYLDYADLIFSEDDYGSRLSCFDYLSHLPDDFESAWKRAEKESRRTRQTTFKILSGRRLFHVAGYVQTMKDSFFLWLRAFDDQVRQVDHMGRGYLQIPAVGCDDNSILPSWLPEYDDFAFTLMPLLVQAIEEVLQESHFPNITTVGFCDSSGQRLFSPTTKNIGHVELIACSGEDICKFDDHDYNNYVCGILNPSSSFCLPGNRIGDNSLDGQIGERTTIRIVQNWINNPRLLDPRNHIAVDGPSQLKVGYDTALKVPCLIGDATSTEEFTWYGVALEKITDAVV